MNALTPSQKAIRAAASRRYRAAHPERVKASKRRYFEANRDKIKARHLAYQKSRNYKWQKAANARACSALADSYVKAGICQRTHLNHSHIPEAMVQLVRIIKQVNRYGKTLRH